MKRAMSSALRLGAKGIKITVSGRLGGNDLQTEWLREEVAFHTLRQMLIMRIRSINNLWNNWC